MQTDLWLAIAHHLLVFSLVAQLVAELVLVRAPMTAENVRRVAGLDAGFGITAGLVIVVGVLRVIYGAKGWDYYQGNPFFWAKMASFAGVGLLSIRPTLRYLRWRKALAAEAAISDTREIARVRMFIALELVLVVFVIGFAAAMARYGG